MEGRWFYILNDANEPVPADFEEMLQWRLTRSRADPDGNPYRVARTQLDTQGVSTIFLIAPPCEGCFFETAVVQDDGKVAILGRATTYAEAIELHNKIVAKFSG